jgi:ABC-2 type transport system permease protein
MRQIFYVMLNDLRVTFSDKEIWINLLIIPVILIVILGAASGGFGESGNRPRQRVDVIDNDGSPLSAHFLAELRALNDTIILCPMDNDADDFCRLDDEPLTTDRITVRLSDGLTRAAIEIPAGFNQNVLTGEPVQIVYRSDEDPMQPGIIIQSVQAGVQRIAAASVAARVGLDVFESAGFGSNTEDNATFRQAVYDRATGIWSELPPVVAYSETARSEEQTVNPGTGFRHSVPGMGSMYVMFTVLAGSIILIQERKNWTLQRLMTMPVTRVQFLGGKVAARFVMGMIQYGVAFTTGLVLGISFGRDPLALILLMVAFTTCITALTVFLATFVTRVEQAGVVTTLMALTLAPLGGAWWPLEIVPDFMRTIGHISPVAWVMNGFTELIFYGGGLADVWVSIVVLLGAAAVLFSIAVTRFNYE